MNDQAAGGASSLDRLVEHLGPYLGGRSLKELAALFGISYASAKRGKRVVRDGTPYMVDSVWRGQISVRTAERILRASSTPSLQDAAVHAIVVNRVPIGQVLGRD